MKPVRFAGGFRKDFKRTAIRRGERLPAAARPHPLKGEWKSYWECHVAPDWLLIYRVTDEEVLLARTGAHADLFER